MALALQAVACRLPPMRIALLSGEYPPQPGGVGDYTRQLVRALSDEGCRVAVFTIQDGHFLLYDQFWDTPATAEPPAVTLRPSADQSPLNWSARAWPYVRAAALAWRPDWLHIQYQTGAYAMRAGINFLPRYLRWMPDRPRIAATFHDLLVPYLFPKAGPVRGWVNRRLAADCDALVATNAADAAQLAGMHLRRPTLATIPIGSNIDVAPPVGYSRAAWRAMLGVAPDELLVAYFGLLSPSKGADLLVEALAELGAGRLWRLLIIGGAATAPQDIAFAAQIERQLAQLGLSELVIRTGHVEPAVVSGHLLAADCVALPFRDGASFRRGSLLAALAHGRPLVTTTPADPDAAAALRDGVTAMVVPPADSAALGAALRRLAEAPALGQAIGAAGRELATGFGWPQIARRHLQLYASVAAI